MMTFTFYVPKKRNDGRPITKKEHEGILRNISKQFGGYTAIPGQVGSWTDPTDGRTYPDASVGVTVACHRERMHEAAEAVRAVGRQLGQLAMWFDVHGADGVEILDIR